MKVRECILRPLTEDIDTVVRVDAVGKLANDVKEYVLTDRLAGEFSKILDRVVDCARPPGTPTSKVGVWISGFFGSGKSHFAKLAGHLLADTPVAGESTRALFKQLLHSERNNDERLDGLLQQMLTHHISCHLTSFDITTVHTAAAESNVGLTFLRAFYRSLNLSGVIPFAEVELELQRAGEYDAFCAAYQKLTSRAWNDDRDQASSLSQFANCLPKFLPSRHPTSEEARQNLQASIADTSKNRDIDRIVDDLLRWLDSQGPNDRIAFVADEVGAWAGSDLKRIEQIRAFVETIGDKGQGRIWLLVTSQEKLSEVVANATSDRDFLQRLEARFPTNVHLESSEVGTVIETRILKKTPAGQVELEKVWGAKQQVLRDVAEPPGLELGANYPVADMQPFVQDYPFLPYQLPAAADLFGGMRGVKVSSGARSMIKVAFDALRDLADRPLGALVSWDQIFDSANSENEFADEQYLGSQGLDYIESADRDITGIGFAEPSRILKALWLVQQSARIPRTERNITRLLTDSAESDVLRLEKQVGEALVALETKNFVRREVGTGQWKFLTQDEVTVEKIVKRLTEDLSASRVRKEVTELCSSRLGALLNGRVTHGVSNTTFDYGISLASVSLKNDSARVQVDVLFQDSPTAQSTLKDAATTLDSPKVWWILPPMPKLHDRIRRALAIEALPADEEFRRIATDRTRAEADKLDGEAAQLKREAETDIDNLFQGGKLVLGGQVNDLDPQTGAAKPKVEAAIGDRIDTVYTRFSEGDKQFKADNIEKLFTAAPGDRAGLDTNLAVFSADGHVNSNNVLVEEMEKFLKSSMKTSGADVAEYFQKPPFGWQPDLLRYVAAAMFVDAKISVTDKAGKAFEDQKNAQARGQFGTQAFKSTRLVIEEDALTPPEVAAARQLLTDLGKAPADGGEIALKEATLLMCSDLTKRSALIGKAGTFEFPLPAIFDGLQAMVDEVQGSGSRVKVVRALLSKAVDFKAINTALRELEEFDKSNGFEQFRRSRQLMRAGIEAGLKEDATLGTRIEEAEDQTEILISERRVLEEWKGSFQKYRVDILEAFRDTYKPLRKELAERTTGARSNISGLPEFEDLGVGDRALVRTEFLSEGKPLQEVTLPELKNEEQLLAANAQLSIPHMRLALSSLDIEAGKAKARIIDLHNAEMQRRGEKAKTATWSPAETFSGKRFQTEDQVDTAFDAEKERLKQLIRDGKTIEVI